MFNSLNQLLKKDNERIIIVEDGQPSFVILPFEEYQHLRSLEKASISIIDSKIKGLNPNPAADRASRIEPNQDIARGDKRQEDFNDRSDDSSPGVKIEDLPF